MFKSVAVEQRMSYWAVDHILYFYSISLNSKPEKIIITIIAELFLMQ